MSIYGATYNPKDEQGNALPAQKLSVEYSFGDDVERAIELFGAKVVYSGFAAHGVVQLQSRMRAAAKAGEDVQATINEWKPGIAAPRRDAVETMEERFEKLTDVQQVALIEKLKAKSEENKAAAEAEATEPETELEPGEED